MADIEFQDNSLQVKAAIENACIAWLYEAAGEIRSRTQRNSRVDTGQTKNSWQYKVDADKKKATIGSPLENAIWEEFGTGQYALHGDGRETPWRYQDVKGAWHTTTGKKPNRSLQKAFDSLKNTLLEDLKSRMKGIG